jgi:RNA polymerase sigma-70 factor (ECF subfamily)
MAMFAGLYIEEHMITALPNVTTALMTSELDRIFRDHYQLIYRTAYGVTGNREDAQDVLQSLFVKLLRQKCPADLKTNPKAYLYRAAVNLSLTTIQQRKRRQLESAEHLDGIAHSAAPTAAERIHRRLYEAVAEFDSATAEILILRYVHNYDIGEIARMLGKSRSAVAVRLFRGRTRLKKLHAPQGAQRKPDRAQPQEMEEKR